MRYSLDRGARRLDAGRVLLAGSPLTLFRLAPAGQRAIDAVERRDDVTASAAVLLDRLVEAGAAHPEPEREAYSLDDVTLVVPVRGHDPWPTVVATGPVGRVIVVDDASTPAVVAPLGSRVEVLRHPVSTGPGAARMTGLARVATPLVAFVDADVLPEPGWLGPLLRHFDDDRVALAAPRVRSIPGPGVIARYEATRSPLDLGPRGGPVRPTTRIGYVPAAALLARVDAVRDVGGFDVALRTGEDVDLVWTLVERRWRVRYEPRSVVRHRPRGSWPDFLRQRVAYGRAAAPLHRRHPGAVAPAVLRPAPVASWLLLALGCPVAAAAAATAAVPALLRALAGVPERVPVALRLTGLGLVNTGEQLASALRREWWPLSVALAVVSRRGRRLFVLAAVLPAAVDWARAALTPTAERAVGPAGERGLDPVRAVAVRLLDDAAYGTGVWAGVWASRDPRALLPRLSPRRRASARRELQAVSPGAP